MARQEWTGDKKPLRIACEIGNGMFEAIDFRGCDFVGPAVLVIDGDCTFSGEISIQGTTEALLWDLSLRRSRTGYIGAITFKNCGFDGCDFQGIGFAGGEDFRREFAAHRWTGNGQH